MNDTQPEAPPQPRWFVEWNLQQRQDYAQRFVKLAAEGMDVDGEARLLDALLDRDSHVLDAGCGVGRVTAALATRGHRAMGVDADPLLIEEGRRLYPGLPLATIDLWQLEPELLMQAGLASSYDLVASVGNVLHFVAEGTQPRILQNLNDVLRPGGLAVFGFATGREFTHDALDACAVELGWQHEHRFGTWQCHPYTADSDWAVSIYRRPLGESA